MKIVRQIKCKSLVQKKEKMKQRDARKYETEISDDLSLIQPIDRCLLSRLTSYPWKENFVRKQSRLVA